MRTLHFAGRTSWLRILLAVAVAAALLGSVVPATAEVPSRETTVRVSVAADGGDATDNSGSPAISADGRYVAFTSEAPDLVPADGNGSKDAFVRDMQTGVTKRVSVAADGGDAVGSSYAAAISADGRYVVFNSYAPDLVIDDGDGNGDAFVRDMQTGVTKRVSVAADGGDANADSYAAAISADGRYVAFYSYASDLVTDDGNVWTDVFVRDMQTGVTKRVSVDTGGNDADNDSSYPSISADGRYVAFDSYASDLVFDDGDGNQDIFVRDMQTGVTERVSADKDGNDADASSEWPAISADGRHVAFQSEASDLVSDDGDSNLDVFVRDMQTGVTERVSVDEDGNGADEASGCCAINGDGRYVAFISLATDLVTGDGNSKWDVFVRDTQTGITERTSVDKDGNDANDNVDDEEPPAISADGCSVAFTSYASDLVESDGNSKWDVFVRNVLPADVTYTAVQGANRYATAIEASKEAFPDGAGSVVIATGTNWPDALGGAALAGALEGPILLTSPTSLPDSVLAEIDRLASTDAVILGGTGAVSAAVQTALETKLGAGHVTRYGGANRYATAELIADAVASELGDSYDGTCFVATGKNFPDALGASPLAAAKGWPIFLAPTGALTANTSSVMDSIGVDEALLLGGEGVVSSAIESGLKTDLGASNVARLAGATRYDTAVEVATYGVESAWMRFDGVALATGQNFPDALAGGVLQGQTGSVMVLTHSNALTPVTAALLQEKKTSIGEVRFLGGTGALSQGVRDAAKAIVQ